MHRCFAEQQVKPNCSGPVEGSPATRHDEGAVTAAASDVPTEPVDSSSSSEEPAQASWNAVASGGSIAGLVDVIDVPQSHDGIILSGSTVGGTISSPLTAPQGGEQAVETGPRSWDVVSSEASITGIVDAIESPESSMIEEEADSSQRADTATTGIALAMEQETSIRISSPASVNSPATTTAGDTSSIASQQHAVGPQSIIETPAVGSFGSMDDAEQSSAAQGTAQRTSLRFKGAKQPIWWPPPEFSSLCGLAVAVMITGISNVFLCKPVTVKYSGQRIVKQCSSCCASTAVQAQHLQYLQRQPQLLLPPLPLPLRQHLEVDQLPPPSYKVPSLVSLPSTQPYDDGLTATAVAAQEWVYSRYARQLAAEHPIREVADLHHFSQVQRTCIGGVHVLCSWYNVCV